jgi:hypothetical protein
MGVSEITLRTGICLGDIDGFGWVPGSALGGMSGRGEAVSGLRGGSWEGGVG